MGQKLAAYNSNGQIIAFYDSEDSPPPDGVSALQITDTQWLDCIATPGYTVVDGVLSPPGAPSLSEVLATAAAALMGDVQAWLDETARGNGYDSLFTCISYLSSSVQQYANDAAAALAWRDAVWPACYQWQQDALANPPSTIPTSQDVIAQLPKPEQFGWVVHSPGATA
ncbi:hypothetical protein [Frateuria sp. YIM B11624]|uniref:hypothetical protein n=1 Tax=Frateuria sp. YIM B11624 TaxID=3143185 RepID=UPI003C72681C